MSSTRSVKSPGIFAADALTTIPPVPVTGVSYRDAANGTANIADGWPYGERVNSAEFNQIVYQLSTLLNIQDSHGLLGWADSVDYAVPALVYGSDGKFYFALQASGPATTPRDPISSPTYWREMAAAGRLIGVQVFEAAGTATYTPTPGTNSVVVEVQGGGGAGGGTAVTGASLTAVGGGGGAGGYACSRFTSGFAGVTVTVGAGGVPAAAAVGGSGGTSSFGALVSAPGGGGGPGGTGTQAAPWTTGGGLGGNPTNGNISNRRGGQGSPSFALNSGSALSGGAGGFSFLGGAGGATSPGNTNGTNSGNYGAGGSGVAMGQGQASVSGGAGFRGIVIVWEYA